MKIKKFITKVFSSNQDPAPLENKVDGSPALKTDNSKKRGPKGPTFEECFKDAQQYASRIQWKVNSPRIYRAAVSKKWMAECAKHMGAPITDPWTLEECMEQAKRFKTRSEWLKNHSATYNAAGRNGWIDQCAAHMERVYKEEWTYEMCLEEARKAGTAGKWQTQSPSSRVQAFKRGWYHSIMETVREEQRASGQPVQGNTRWDFEMCLRIAQRYQSRSEWRAKDLKSYRVALKYKWLKECTKHMKNKKIPKPSKWTLEACILDARKHRAMVDWQKSSYVAFAVARAHGWLPQCCAHMSDYQPSHPTNSVKAAS